MAKDKQDILLATQHNQLIESRYQLTLQEKRLLLFLISKIDLSDKDFLSQTFAIKDLAALIGGNNNRIYQQMPAITRKLMSRVIEIYDAGREKLVQLQWVTKTSYYYGKGEVTLCLSRDLAPYLLELKRCFTTMRLDILFSLHSIYAVRIYELLKQYEKIGSRTFDIEELKKKLSLQDGEYQLYGHLKSKILLVAQREINEKTDLLVEFQEIKEGRKIKQICFNIKTKPAHVIASLTPYYAPEGDKPVPPEIPADLLQRLKYLGLSKEKSYTLFLRYGDVFIWQKLKDFDAAIEAGKEVSNPAGWLISSIEKDWNYKSPLLLEQEQKEQEERERQERERQAAVEQSKLEAERKTKRLEFDRMIKELFLSRWSALSPAAQAAIIYQADFNKMEQRSYDKNGVEKSPVAILKLQKIVLLEHELNFEQWLETQTA